MEYGPILWFIVLIVGAIVLLTEMASGTMRNRALAPAEKQLTEEATRRSKR